MKNRDRVKICQRRLDNCIGALDKMREDFFELFPDMEDNLYDTLDAISEDFSYMEDRLMEKLKEVK